ncbi:hypothetical protein MW887_001685 [Aspergillus wentii]|nr:hypothetical protein MW887_001685 [Aspergillus wentii]
MEIADAELLRFIREVKSRRSFLMAKIDNAASTVDKELEEITSNITVQQERLGNQLASFQAEDFIYMEVNAFREHFEQQVQVEIDRQIPHVQSFLDELKEAKQAIPSPVEIQAHYEDFQNEVKRFKNQIIGILARIDADSVSYDNFGVSMKPTDDFLSFIPINQEHTPAASEGLFPEIESESLDDIHMSEEGDTTWSSLEHGGSEECQEPRESDGDKPEEREEIDEIEKMEELVDMEESQEQEEGKETEKTELFEEKGESHQGELEERRDETPAGVAQWFAASGSPPLTPDQLEDGRRIRRERVQRRLKAARRHQRNRVNKTPSFEHLYRHSKGKCPSTNKGQRMTSQFDASETLIGLGLKEE